MSAKLKDGDKALDFSLLGYDGNTYSLNSFNQKILVLYFYPKDNFEKLNAKVVGISPDSAKSHCNFIDKHNLKLTLLSDPDKRVAESYGAFGEKKMYGKITFGIIRSTFIIKDEKILKAYYNVKAKGHAEKVLEDLKELVLK